MWEQEAALTWLIILFTIILALIIWTLTSITSNYAVARRIGFPIIISPVSTLNPLWIITYRVFPPILQLKRLPFGTGVWARCTYMGWQFDDKYALHSSLGPIFTIVTPGGNELVVADPSAVHHILSRRKDFIKPAIMYDQLNVFGPNVNTVEGDDWQRQRKLTAPNFNEKISEQVWEETVRQAGEMIMGWVRAGREGTREVAKDTATVALHVLTAVGFGVIYPFHGGVGEVHADKGHAMSYREALQICLANIITFSTLPRSVLEMAWMPKRIKRVGQAAREFQGYMEELLTVEKVLNISGSSQTAGDYETCFPKLQRCLAVMVRSLPNQSSLRPCATANPFPLQYETLRLYGSIVFIPKTTGPHTQPLNMDNKTHIVPPNTAIIVNVQALHVHPGIWGTDALSWRPDRWLLSQSRSAGIPPESPRFIDPQSGSFIPWADGPRVCMGRKFSQVSGAACG